jgi:hypothetical protein
MIKNYVCLVGIVLLVGCDQKTKNADSNVSMPKDEAIIEAPNRPVVVIDEKNGNFTVDAKSGTGATFENKADHESTFTFAAKGLWSFAPAAGLLGPVGADSPATTSYLMPGARSFALVAKRGDGTFAYVGDGTDLTLKPHEVISFLMNDLKEGAVDNRGSLQITWTRK